jgi:hypothetical protein
LGSVRQVLDGFGDLSCTHGWPERLADINTPIDGFGRLLREH